MCINKYDYAAGDFGTPEQEILEETSDYDWESCMTMNDTWWYRKDDDNWKSSEQLIYNLIDEFLYEEISSFTYNLNDEILTNCIVTHKGEFINKSVKERNNWWIACL